MHEARYDDDMLNMFIDEQLETSQMDEIRAVMLEDETLRQRICQLKAVRELVSYAYESLPADHQESGSRGGGYVSRHWMSFAASILVVIAMLVGWNANTIYHDNAHIASSGDVFKYYKSNLPVSAEERKIILHVTTGDVYAVNKALNEAEQLLASYRSAGTPMKLDIITYKEGINMLRVGASPYVQRIARLLSDNENVELFACQRSIDKARKREGKDIELMPQTITAKTARDLITERLDKGWIYIKV